MVCKTLLLYKTKTLSGAPIDLHVAFLQLSLRLSLNQTQNLNSEKERVLTIKKAA